MRVVGLLFHAGSLCEIKWTEGHDRQIAGVRQGNVYVEQVIDRGGDR